MRSSRRRTKSRFVEIQERVGQQGLAPQGLDLGHEHRGVFSDLGIAPLQGGRDRGGLLLVVGGLPQKLLAARVAVAESRDQVLDGPLQGLDVGPLEILGGAGDRTPGRKARKKTTGKHNTQSHRIRELHNIKPLLGQEGQGERILWAGFLV